MIEQIGIKNFKSLADVTINFKKFNCFVGMNGAGKTSILQALDFISQQMRGDLTGWLAARGWTGKDLGFKGGGPHPKIPATVIEVYYRISSGELIRWIGFFSRTKLQMVTEIIEILGAEPRELLRTVGQIYRINGTNHASTFNYEGSILSQLKDELLSAPLLELRSALGSIRSLELLSPHLLRKRSRSHVEHIGVGGEKLAGFLDTIKGVEKENLVTLLKAFYPLLTGFKISTAKGGWKRLVISESRVKDETEENISVETDAIHLNDGLLRILAILAQAEANDAHLLLLDEIENGINPEIIEKLVNILVNSSAQIAVTTHSPMILNYFDDAIASDAVQFVYKGPNGQTGVRPFFSIPRVAEKLKYMGPGEAFIDTNLHELTDECIHLDRDMAVIQEPA